MSHERRGRGVICWGLAASVDLRLLRSAGRNADAMPTPTIRLIQHQQPMKILLSNDDGFQAPGIVALYEALKTRGQTLRSWLQSTTTAQSRTP